ncbi:MAG: hypothetical protein WA304_03400 [Candidatus Cybelea sp.]
MLVFFPASISLRYPNSTTTRFSATVQGEPLVAGYGPVPGRLTTETTWP